MKGLILSGGKGTRLRPFTYTGAKQLVPLANKPVLFYAIENLVAAGIKDIGIVVGDTAEEIKGAVGNGSRFGARINYIPQEAPLGIAHGVKIARPYIGKDRFVLFLGDNFIREGINSLVERFQDSEVNSLILLAAVENPWNFGVAECVDGQVVKVVEKPQNPKSNLAVTGIYMFDEFVFEAINNIKPSARGELEITDTIQYLIDNDYSVLPHILEDHWIDTGKMEDILEANRLVLETLDPRVEGSVDAASKVLGRVVVETGAELINSEVRGPAIIGERTRLINSHVGPGTSIYHDCEISNSEIDHSIILENTRIADVEHRIVDSLIGRNVEISKAPSRPRAHRLVLGDYSKVKVL
jgi:glucose-1-phosphate thymidylyltransferase